NKPGFDDLSWSNAAPAEETVGKLVAQPLEPIRVTATVKPVKITEPEEGVYVVDMGQNFSGLASFKFNLQKGTKVNIRYGELLNEDGTLNPMTSVCGQIKRKRNDDLESHPGVAWQNDVYFAKGGGLETYTPRFSWHAFRYLEITGIDAKPTLDMVVGHRLNSDVKRVGSFSCSNEMFNSIQKICDWTFLSNIFSVQSDCPHRERFGYGGDLVNTNETFIYNYDMSSFYAKAITDWDDSKLKDGMLTDTAPSVGIQYCGVGWAMAHPHTQLKLYQYYGDKRIIEEQYETSKQWLGLVTESNSTNIVSNGLSDHETLSRKSTAPKYRIELLAGGVVVASKSGLASPDGSRFVKADLTYKSGSDVLVDPNVGMPLEVRLLAEYTQEYDQLDFDKVELTNDLPNYVVTFKEPSYVLEFSDRNYVAPGMEFGFVTKKADRKFDFTYSYPDANEPDILIGKNLSSVVPIVNGGFEDADVVNGWSVDEVSGWSEGWYDLKATNPDKWVDLGDGMDLNCGVYDPNGIYNGKAPEGENVSYVECDRGYISGLSQVLSENLQANTKYTLSVEVGNPSVHRRRAPMVTPLYYQSAKMLEKMAGILGYQEDAEKYAALSADIEKAYNEKYFNPKTGRCSPGTQSSQSFSLFSDLIADGKRPAAVKYLLDDISEHDGHLTTGIFGTRYMLETLSREGYGQVAYDIVNQKTFPGWGHMLDNGATTLWEHWAYSDNTFSHNHPMFGSVSQWFYNWLGGIQPHPDAVGFDRIIIRPLIPADLNWVNSSYDSVRGKVTSNWKKAGDSLVMDIVIPANAVSTVYVPCDSPEGIKEGGKPASQAEGIEFVRYENNAAIYKVQSGTYQFTVPK
ncbi:MAG: glycoside hydrolase family 78 protein, partial [Phycisphaerae bacterium]|nr:glycoside hydrolase family 78 protein [Phycisphaerae bacterium]